MGIDSEIEVIGETPSSSIPPLPPSCLGKRKSRKSSDVWEHFTVIVNPDAEDVRCACNYCGQDYACGARKYGTSTLRNHLILYCKKYPGRLEDKRQKSPTEGGLNILVGFNKEECRLACAKMVILDELPFSFVEGEGFRQFCKVACPKFEPPSRRTVVRYIYQLYLDQKLQLKRIIQRQRVYLTTDTWSSIQNINYMCLTAHYVDFDWKLHKWILGFCVIANHKGETIGKAIETCLRVWGIEKLFTITVDNATTNETAISYIKRKMIGQSGDGCVLDGKYLHMRCCAHIVNLIVSEGLKEAHDSIVSIRNAVKYVKSSPAREQKLKECASEEKIDCKLSCEVCSLVTELEQLSSSGDFLLGEMAINMKKKFDKYWEKMENVNQLLLIATVLDPRYKLAYADFCFGDIYGDKEVACNMTKILKDNLTPIFDWYVRCETRSESNQVTSDLNSSSEVSSTKESPNSSVSLSCVSRFKRTQAAKDVVELKNDVDKYLLDACENIKDDTFDVLNWWKLNGNKYGTLSKLARDVMAIQVSTVASESAFSTGGRILDPFRSSLTPRMVGVLVCTQNWIKESTSMEKFYIEDVEEYNKLDAELLESEKSNEG